jgi:phosphoglycolate phosphatase-like HAD superfamily hydrolase
MIKCVVFDFDGTLVDSNAIKKETFFAIARPWDQSGEVVAEVFERWPVADRYEKTRKIAEGLISRKLLPKGSSAQEWASRLASEYTKECENAIGACAEMPGATRTLDELAEKGLLLFVNSATPVEPLRKILELRDWIHFFRGVYGAEAAKTDNLGKIAVRTGTKPHEIVHVGDQPDDLLATKQFGCHFVAMAAHDTRPIAKASSLVVQELRELSGLLSKLNQESS